MDWDWGSLGPSKINKNKERVGTKCEQGVNKVRPGKKKIKRKIRILLNSS
jgi:hypothetical protein